MLPLLLATEVTDPTAVVLAAGSSVITFLLGIVVALVSARNKRNEDDIKSLRGDVNGLSLKTERHDGSISTAKVEIDGLKGNTLTKEFFKSETEHQNRILEQQVRDLDDLRTQNATMSATIVKLREQLVARPTRSEIGVPAARVPREDPPSDPPVTAPRSRLPSRPGYRGGAE